MTSIGRYNQASRDLLKKAEDALAQGDLVQASEKGWGAAAQIVKAVADARRWRHNGHRELFDVVRRLADETSDQDIWDLFHLANSLHSNFYENWLPKEGVARGLVQIREFVDKLEPLAA